MSQKNEIVITGVHGFVGRHLANYLYNMGTSVHGVGREDKADEHISLQLRQYSQCNLLKASSMQSIDIRDSRAIIHLAGLASVSDSFKFPEQYKADNQTMTTNLLMAAKDQGYKGRIVVVSTGAIYDSHQPMPINESGSTTDNSPYAAGKIAVEEVALKYKKAGLDIVIARPFNHIGPGQTLGFLLPDLYAQVIDAQKQKAAKIFMGNLTTKRDYTDVRDIVKAYELLASADVLGYDVYNIASGKSHSGLEILDELQRAMNYRVDAVVDQSKIRPGDASEITGDASRLKNELGWAPSIALPRTIADFVTSKQ